MSNLYRWHLAGAQGACFVLIQPDPGESFTASVWNGTNGAVAIGITPKKLLHFLRACEKELTESLRLKHGSICPDCGDETVVNAERNGWHGFECSRSECDWAQFSRAPPAIEEIAERLREVNRLVGTLKPHPNRGAALHVATEQALGLAEFYRMQDQGAEDRTPDDSPTKKGNA